MQPLIGLQVILAMILSTMKGAEYIDIGFKSKSFPKEILIVEFQNNEFPKEIVIMTFQKHRFSMDILITAFNILSKYRSHLLR